MHVVESSGKIPWRGRTLPATKELHQGWLNCGLPESDSNERTEAERTARCSSAPTSDAASARVRDGEL